MSQDPQLWAGDTEDEESESIMLIGTVWLFPVLQYPSMQVDQ